MEHSPGVASRLRRIPLVIILSFQFVHGVSSCAPTPKKKRGTGPVKAPRASKGRPPAQKRPATRPREKPKTGRLSIPALSLLKPVDGLSLKPKPRWPGDLVRGALRRYGTPRVRTHIVIYHLSVTPNRKVIAGDTRGGDWGTGSVKRYDLNTGNLELFIPTSRWEWSIDPGNRRVAAALPEVRPAHGRGGVQVRPVRLHPGADDRRCDSMPEVRARARQQRPPGGPVPPAPEETVANASL